ncbi:MAG TPA: twin-arginine translocase subunit TatC [Solirubrobacterales bacterium]|jgi:sec-independent protein translocase protein TatC|nr:twin-arginine translocase subunit TatC [Solirubrobacterales bacterium]
MARLKPASFDDRMTLVEHLDELRSRIVVSAFVLAVAIGLCFWQNDLLLEVANKPLPANFEPITFSPTEPFFTTVKLSVYGGLLLTLPIILYQAYAFVLPAFSPHEKRVVVPFLLMIPFLFVGGAVFAYFVVMPAALDFLLSFNADEFNIEVRASEYYGFFVLTLIAVGLLFQIPVGTLAVTRLGIVTPEQLASNRRYAVLVIAVAAMLLPGTDPVTMLLAMLPLYGLFEFSLVLARAFGRPPSELDVDPEIGGPDAPAHGAG